MVEIVITLGTVQCLGYISHTKHFTLRELALLPSSKVILLVPLYSFYITTVSGLHRTRDFLNTKSQPILTSRIVGKILVKKAKVWYSTPTVSQIIWNNKMKLSV